MRAAAGVSLAHSVIVTGTDLIKPMCMLAPRGARPFPVIVADIERKKLEMAKRAEARAVFVVDEEGGDAVDADVCIEASVAEKALGWILRRQRAGALSLLWV